MPMPFMPFMPHRRPYTMFAPPCPCTPPGPPPEPHTPRPRTAPWSSVSVADALRGISSHLAELDEVLAGMPKVIAVNGAPLEPVEGVVALSLVDSAELDGGYLRFKAGDAVLFSVDASPFIKDGMVDAVEIVGGNLVITFNTDSGKRPVSIPLTDIFDSDDYYNKAAVDRLLADMAELKADSSAVADPFSASRAYDVGDVVMYNGSRYYCRRQHAAGPFVTLDFEKETVEDVLAGKQDALSAAQLANIAAVPSKADSADLSYRIVEVTAPRLPEGVTYGSSADSPLDYTITFDNAQTKWILRSSSVQGVDLCSWDVDGTNGSNTDSGIHDFYDTDGEMIRVPALDVSYPLANRTVNVVTLPAGLSEATLKFPTRLTGYSRDFLVRLVIEGSDVPQISFVEPDGTAVAFDEDDEAWADIGQGVNILIFTDTAEPGGQT